MTFRQIIAQFSPVDSKNKLNDLLAMVERNFGVFSPDMELDIRATISKDDIKDLAVIYKELYDDVDIGEFWSIESAERLLNYWYDKQSDLFFVAEEDGKPVGAVMSGIKPWFDGNRLIDTEIFVSNKYQGKHIANGLYKIHLETAVSKYDAKVIEFHTYGDENEFPQNWYNRIGFKKDNELIIMSGDIKEILNNLK